MFSDDYLREGLISEIKVMQKLKSPNIVQLMDVMETNNNYYIIQEYCDSGDLDKMIEKYQYTIIQLCIIKKDYA